MRNVFERSANRGNGNNVSYCNASGNLNNNNANNGNYCAPDCVAKAGLCGASPGDSPATQSKEPPSRACGREQAGGAHVPALRGGGISGAPEFDDAFGLDHLLKAESDCLSSVMWKGTSQYVYLHAVEVASALCDELHGGSYRQRPCREFMVTSPKPRLISSIALRDRIVQRSLNDNVIYPIMSRSWIYDNYACQIGKGTDFARRRMSTHLERHYRGYGASGWVLVIDVLGYYEHMLHSITASRFREKLPPWAADFALLALSTQYGGSVGYKPGSQMVQIAGMDYLDPVDHMIKERLGVRGYGRYMDDLILIHHDRAYLERCLSEIAAAMAKVGLSPHPKKTRLQPVCQPFGFLGFNYHIRDGGVSMLVKPEKVKEQRRRLRHLARLVRDGRLDAEGYLASLECMVAHIAKGDNRELPDRQRSYGMAVLKGAVV